LPPRVEVGERQCAGGQQRCREKHDRRIHARGRAAIDRKQARVDGKIGHKSLKTKKRDGNRPPPARVKRERTSFQAQAVSLFEPTRAGRAVCGEDGRNLFPATTFMPVSGRIPRVAAQRTTSTGRSAKLRSCPMLNWYRQ